MMNSESKYWWLLAATPIAVYPVVIIIGLVVVLLSATTPVFGAVSPQLLGQAVGYGALPAFLVSPIGIHFDRKHVRERSNWSPSIAYYLTPLYWFGSLVAAVYVYRRWQFVGLDWPRLA